LLPTLPSQYPNHAALIALSNAVVPFVYSLEPSVRELGFPDRPAVSTYYSDAVTRAQIDVGTLLG
jgi:hypothetical protein